MKKDNVTPNDIHGNGGKAEVPRVAGHKGKQDVNLRKRGFIRFQAGLIIALLLVYFGLEASFRIQQEVLSDPEAPRERAVVQAEMPVFKVEAELPVMKKKKLAVPPQLPDEPIEDKNLMEAVIENPGPEPKGLSLDSISYDDPVKEEIPTILPDFIEDGPIFPGCEEVAKEDRFACFQEKLTKHVKRHFRYPETAIALGLEGRVNVIFKVGVSGEIIDVQLKGPHQVLEKEAARIIEKLPQMTPGRQAGKAVKVPYSIPIKFKLN